MSADEKAMLAAAGLPLSLLPVIGVLELAFAIATLVLWRWRTLFLWNAFVMTMEADTAHKFWLGKINVTVALARGQMKAKGPVAKILKLVPLVKPVFPRYKAQLEAEGREDLVNVS